MNKTNTKKIRISKKWLLFALMLFVCVAATAYAVAPATGTTTGTGLAGTATNAFNDAMMALANLLIAVLGFLKKVLWPIFLLIGGLLNNDLLFGAGMEERILLIWTQIRNFVNIGFVLILVGVALYNVTGFAKEEFDLKKFLPKFAIALIAVNFSYVALKIVLDVTNVFTVAIFAMPKTISADLLRANSLAVEVKPGEEYRQKCYEQSDEGCDKKVGETEKKEPITEKDRVTNIVNSFCSTLYGNVTTSSSVDTTDVSELYCKKAGSPTQYVLTNSGAKFFSSFTSNNAALILAIQYMNIVDVDKVSQTLTVNAASKTVDFQKITLNLIFSTMLYIIYGVAYVSLFILLLVRLVVLWLILILSPLIALKLAGIKVAEGGDDYGKMFVQHAVAPVKVAVVLTIGYMILEVFRDTNIYKSDQTLSFGTSITKLQTELSGISTLQGFVMAAAAVIFVWIGVKQATKETKAGSMIEGLMGKVQQAGKTVAGLWRYAPVIPTGEGKSSFMQLRKTINAPLEKLRTKYGGESTGELAVSEIQAMKGKRLTGEELKEAARKLQSGGFTSDRHTQATRDVLQTWAKSGTSEQKKLASELQTKLTNPAWREYLKKGTLTTPQKATLTQALGAFVGRGAGTPPPRTPGAPGTTPGGATPSAGQPAVASEQGRQAGLLRSARDGNSAAWQAVPEADRKAVSDLIDKRVAVQNNEKLSVNDRKTQLEAIDKDIAGNAVFTKATNTLAAASDLSTAAAPYKGKAEIKGDDKKNLEAALKQATNALKAKKITGNDAKQIIRKTLEASGVKVEVVQNDRQLKQYI